MHLVAGYEVAKMGTELVIWVGRNVVELIYGDQTVIEGCNAKLVYRKAKGGMGADQYLVSAFQKGAQGFDLAAIVGAWCIAQIPLGLYMPVRPEAIVTEWLIIEAGADGFFWYNYDGLLQALVVQLVQGNKHQGTALARGWR